MDLGTLFDPLFRLPFLVGLLITPLLPLLGALLRLREEWLAALGFAHLAAATGLGGMALGIPAVIGAPLGSGVGVVVKTLLGARGNSVYAFLILAGWSTTLLLAANTALGSAMGHALVDGQLYFAGHVQLGAGIALMVLMLFALPSLIPRLIRATFFPRFDGANRLPAWRWHLGFDLLVAVAMGVGTGTLGLMAAFALVLVPPWLAFRIAPSWRATLIWSGVIGLIAYMVAFTLALGLDQPFGPVLVMVLILGAGITGLASFSAPSRGKAREGADAL